MALTVLSDRDVNRLLHSFTKADIEHLQQQLGDALHWYSTSSDANEYCSDYQPERVHMKRKDGSTSLFMPASSYNGQGIKVLNITPPDTAGLPSLENLSLDTDDSSRSSISTSADSPRGSVSSHDTKGSNSYTLPDSINSESTAPSSSTSTIRGSLTLLDSIGNTTALINASEITAFRTALASTMMLKKRHSVHDLTVFGAGKQAYWHIRLALLLRGDEIHHLNLITRNFESAAKCYTRLYNPLPDDQDFSNTLGNQTRTRKNILTPSHTEYERLLKEYVRASNVIFCCTPSTSPLFPAGYLTNPEGRRKGRYIACVGSYKPHMIELHPDVLRYAVEPHHEKGHFHRKHAKEGGAVIVDTVTGCLKEAGEVVQAKLLPDQVVEIGELFMLKREAEDRHRAKGEHVEGGCAFQENSGLKEWLTRGNVIYKSVGLGLMDVVVGNGLVEFAKERGVGTRVENFN
ncbi:hypothetical protein LTR37_000828 [Vermiconidia calcicola]|uniref:Uncharacterized protein n=1 Tax=Vermiconidia calcicola TaxID=1690605 RepID=A0ACC3NYR5_9PEZI|nr:hypothetical protein LTR37_000828 [Vermiconidia calcicola]